MSTKEDDIKYLRSLAEVIRHIPGTYNVDDGDIDRVQHIAARLEGSISYTEACPTCKTGEHVEEQGESGEFWWHCHQCESPFEMVDKLTAESMVASVIEQDVVVPLADTVHILYGGHTYCGITEAPGHWRNGQSWAHIEDYEHANCAECLSKLLTNAVLCTTCSAVLVDGGSRVMRSAIANTTKGPHCGGECRKRLCKHCVDERCRPGHIFCGAACSQEYEMENN